MVGCSGFLCYFAAERAMRAAEKEKGRAEEASNGGGEDGVAARSRDLASQAGARWQEMSATEKEPCVLSPRLLFPQACQKIVHARYTPSHQPSAVWNLWKYAYAIVRQSYITFSYTATQLSLSPILFSRLTF
eukprot:COSAG05_NODE_716_length_7804_cov_2.669825_3_plen_132_part_00